MNHHPPHTVPPFVINLFFIIGLISALAFRALIVFSHVRHELFRPVWYLGIIGYVFFFLYRYIISEKRKKAINDYDLIAKLQDNLCLTEEDRVVVVYLLSSIKKSRENINYLFIFGLSIVAIVTDILLTFYGK
jgi:hypothetical protein